MSMGLMSKSKQTTIRDSAKRAVAEGRNIFLARYWDEVMNFQGTGPISGASEAIEMVEAEGWLLQDIAYSWVERKNRGVTVMVFRRKEQ
jgi:hypothetical protein